eukprot:TRINITY_DN13776_c0_g1_i1.p1 TRINITY_DN13776_c0_g1~~TRINITY_DN13776_c0_g1_i1.p1  ORF type:complete len:414 (+),score=49.99 TRINITY_DN13776_c0_g1_i1:77-1243(+)
MAGVSVLSSRRSGVSAADMALETDVEFKNHPKFHKPSSVFSSKSGRFRRAVPVSPAPNVYHPHTSERQRGALLSLTSKRTPSAKPCTDAFYEVAVPSSVRRGSLSGSAPFVSKSPRAFPSPRDGVDPTRYSPNFSPTVPATKNAAAVVFRSSASRSVQKDSVGAGPGAYFASTSQTHQSPRTVSSSFRSRSPRMGSGNSTNTPFGTHEVVAGLNKKGGAAAAFRSKSPRMRYNHPDTPAPGAYDAVDPSRRDSRVFSIPRSPRPSITAYETPPSGAFRWEGTSLASRSGVLGTAAPKVVAVNRSSTPGPGSYNYNTSTLGKKSVTSFRSGTSRGFAAPRGPGPGSHHVPSKFPTGRSALFEGPERFKSRPNHNPGPGHFIKNYSSFLE